MILLASTVLGLLLGVSAPLGLRTAVPENSWHPEVGDFFVVDTKENIGYLSHSDGVYITFKLATGQRRHVYNRAIGYGYSGETPEGFWLVKSEHIQGDKITYGPSGKFLRLYKDGEKYTHYGIHNHAYSTRMLEEEDRYESLGCVIVSEDILSILEDTFNVNKQLPVITKYGLDREIAQY